MKVKWQKNKALLLANATAVASVLQQQCKGTRLRIRIPKQASLTNTDGWYATIGDLDQLILDVWFDRFSGYRERRFYAGFVSSDRRHLIEVTKRVSRRLWPTRVVTLKEVDDSKKNVVLTQRLARSEFNRPILEKYPKATFFGIYDPTRVTAEKVNPHFCSRAVAFIEDVARALPSAAAEDEYRDVYPQLENRKMVVSHLQRERNTRLLAVERKIRDKYKCCVCGMRFEKFYGSLGHGYAEVHHVVPLGKIRGRVLTRIEDLCTVCANCHRMLHRMSGNRDDISRLRAIVGRRRT